MFATYCESGISYRNLAVKGTEREFLHDNFCLARGPLGGGLKPWTELKPRLQFAFREFVTLKNMIYKFSSITKFIEFMLISQKIKKCLFGSYEFSILYNIIMLALLDSIDGEWIFYSTAANNGRPFTYHKFRRSDCINLCGDNKKKSVLLKKDLFYKMTRQETMRGDAN